jgi:hypothetical protein
MIDPPGNGVTKADGYSGNWNDKTVANHATDHLERDTGKAGLTLATGASNVSGTNVDINVNVNWYYDAKDGGTDVITRELEHVQTRAISQEDIGMGVRPPASVIFVSSEISSGASTLCRN